MRLNSNQLAHRTASVLKSLRHATDGLDKADVRAILRNATSELLPDDLDESAESEAASMEEKILAAIHAGLEAGDAQMVRAALQWQEEQAGKEYLSELTVQIVPYTIADKSLRRIVLEAGDDIVSQIEAALVERRANGIIVDQDLGLAP